MPRGVRVSRLLVLFGMLAMLAAVPVSAQEASPGVAESPALSVTDRLEDRRYVTTGNRGYVAGTQDGRFPAMGFHTRGEMGGVWAPPIKLLDGLWFGIGEDWIGPATEFTSGYGYVEMDLPDRDGLEVKPHRLRPRRPSRSPIRPHVRGGRGRPQLHPEVAGPLRAHGRLPVGRDDAEPAGLQPGGRGLRRRREARLPGEGHAGRGERRAARLGGGRGVQPRADRAARPGKRTAARRTRQRCVPRPPTRPPTAATTRPTGRAGAANSPTTSASRRTGSGPSGSPSPGRTSTAMIRRTPGPRHSKRTRRCSRTRGRCYGRRSRYASSCRRTRASTCPATAGSRRASTGASRTSPTPCRWPRTSRSARRTPARTTPRPEGRVGRARFLGAGFPDYRGSSAPTASSPPSRASPPGSSGP